MADQLRLDCVARLRRVMARFVSATEEFKAASEEAELLGLFAQDGGLAPEDLTGVNEGLTPADLAAAVQVLADLLTPITLEQRQAIYKVRAPASFLSVPPGFSL